MDSPGPGGGGAPQPSKPRFDEPAAIEPSDAWLDFDSLELGDASMGGTRRGRLFRRDEDEQLRGARYAAVAAIERSSPGLELRDPATSRGMFDHRYPAEGGPEVPSDGQPHRIMLGAAEAVPQIRWRTVPREGAEVYREVELKNPFDAPLLAGPVDVYVDGSLLVTTPIDRIDRGGTMHIGMGVEDRIRVARNARVEEDSAGLLGGSIAIRHMVSIDLSSSLGAPATVEVIDRIPVTDEKGIEVKLVESEPPAEPYKQEERGRPIRGGLAWRLALAPGAKRSISYQYRLTLSSKNELIGGNRRE